MALHKDEFADDKRRSNKPKNRSRFTIDVDDDLRRKVRIIAAKKDVSVNQYVTAALKEKLARETIEEEQVGQPVSQEAIDRLQRFHDRLACETHGELFDGTTELIRTMREERTKYLMGEE